MVAGRAAGAIGGAQHHMFVPSLPRLVSFVSNDDEPYRGRAASSSTQMRLFPSLPPSPCSVSRSTKRPSFLILRPFNAALLVVVGYRQRRRARSPVVLERRPNYYIVGTREKGGKEGSRCCRCCAAVTASSVVARLESDERRTSHCPCPPSSTTALGELGDCKSLCRQAAALVPPPPVAMEWTE